MENKNIIGIVGGMGPSTGIDLFQKIINLTNATNDYEHLPVSLISEPNLISDRTKFLMGEIKINPAIAISKLINKLYFQQATIIGMPCNTAHSPKIFNEILKRIPNNIQLINMIDSVCKFIKEKYPLYKNIGILLTDHNVRETLKIVDKVYILNEGTIFFEGNPEDAIKNEKIKKFYLGSNFSI